VSPVDVTSVILIAAGALGLMAAAGFALLTRDSRARLRPRTALARAASYAVLAVALLAATRTGVPGVAVLIGALGTAALLEWGRLFDLPVHHRVAVVVAHVVIVFGVAVGGVGSADSLVAGVVLVGAAWPVIRPDTGRAVRDLGFAAVGCVVVSVLLVHGLALVVERGETGTALLVALAVACAGSDVGAFLIGRRYGKTPLAPRLSPSKTRAGLVGNLLGAGVAIAPFAPALVPAVGPAFVALLVPLAAGGSVWGDLLESAVKREAGVKDAGSWLPGFGGILDRIDSLVITVALAYWAVRLTGVG
jgi:phosphatidate cytidylyltransferase